MGELHFKVSEQYYRMIQHNDPWILLMIESVKCVCVREIYWTLLDRFALNYPCKPPASSNIEDILYLNPQQKHN